MASLHVEVRIADEVSDCQAIPTAYPLKRRRVLVLGGLLYLMGVLGYAVTTNMPSLKTSEPFIWGLCLPYAVLMTQKLLKVIRSMEGTDDSEELVNTDNECEDQAFGTHASHDVIAVVGDVCVYIIGMVLLCYGALPGQLSE